MKKILNVLTHPILLSLIGLTAISLLIWFFGPQLKFGEANKAPLASEFNRLLAIVVVLVLWGLNNLRIQRVETKKNNALVDDLQHEFDKAPNEPQVDQSAEEVAQIGERFGQALATLKDLKFKGRGARSGLYELPWYIIIGPPGSGKTTALINSSLDFPLAKDFGQGAVQGIGGTRNCDWWFTNEAVLIDTAGRYTTQDSHRVIDSSAWEGFLGLLKKHRRRRPINGAVVSISLQELLTFSPQERLNHAKTIRARIDELMEKLEIRFPVYLMFTKSDLVAGFTEFFDDLNRDDREQVLGISLPHNPNPQQSPDLEFISHEYKTIVKGFYDRLLWRVHQERDLRRRSKVQGFPSQMENLQQIIDSFLQEAFAANRFKFQPLLRGVYFTSGTQDGTPIDRLMSSVSSEFGFERQQQGMHQQQGKSYFISHLFKQVIFPESELVGSNRRYDSMMSWFKRSAYISMTAGFAALSFVWYSSINSNQSYMADVALNIEEFNQQKTRLNKYSKDIRSVLPTLDPLARASSVYDAQSHPWLMSLGMYDANVDKAADSSYHHHLKTVFLPKLMQYIERDLARGNKSDDLYQSFRAYMMLNKLVHLDKEIVSQWFIKQWQTDFKTQKQTRQALTAHLNALMALEFDSAPVNKRLVASTRRVLLQMPIAKRVYQRIVERDIYRDKLELAGEFGRSTGAIFTVNSKVAKSLSIPILYTKQGYDSVDFSSGSEILTSLASENWLFTDNQEQAQYDREELGEISEKVKQYYLTDYANHWNRALNALSVKPFGDLNNAASVLGNLSDPVYSPLIGVLEVTAANTQLTDQTITNVAENYNMGRVGRAADFAASKVKWTSVDKRFRALNALVKESGTNGAPINTTLEKIAALQLFMEEIAMAPDPQLKAFEITRARYQSGGGNAISTLKAYAKSTPKPIRTWLMSIANQSWRVIVQSAHRHVSNEWRARVYDSYSYNLANRFPLNRAAQDEIAMHDFVEFFKPMGVVDTFFNEMVKPFIDTRNGWRNKSVDGYNLGLSSNALTQIKRAMDIKEVFFRNNANSPTLEMQAKPSFMTKNNASFRLDMGQSRLTYSHGPKFSKPLLWNASDDNTRLRIIFEDLYEQQNIQSFEGPWAWFRLLNSSTIAATNRANTYQVTFTNDTDVTQKMVYLLSTKSVKNPFKDDLFSQFQCPEKI